MTATYKIIGADGAEYGPVTLNEFRNWVKEGRVVGSTLIQRTGDDAWSTAASFPELGVTDRADSTGMDNGAPFDFAEAQTLEKRIKTSGSWFYWIAALTLINTIVALTGHNWGFVLGLSVTQVIDYAVIAVVPKDYGMVAKLIALAVDIAAVATFVFLGMQSWKKHTWAFAVGVTLYGLDTLLTLLSLSPLSIGIHGWALFSLVLGLKATQQWKRLCPVNAPEPAGTAQPGVSVQV